MSSHFRGADNPNWAFTKDTEKLINQQEKKMKLTSKVRADFRFFRVLLRVVGQRDVFRKRPISHKIYVRD